MSGSRISADDQAELDELLRIFRGNREALDLLLKLKFVSHVWDDLIDQDRAVTPAAITRCFMILLHDIPMNPFYRAHEQQLLPVLLTSQLNYVAANDLERGDRISREIAHCARYAIGDVSLLIAHLVGGGDWATKHAATLKRMAQKDCLSNFLKEMEAKYGPVPESN